MKSTYKYGLQISRLLIVAGLLMSGISCSGNSKAGNGTTTASGIEYIFPQESEAKPFSLAEFRGRVAIVDIWATWCPPCREEIPGFINLYEKYKDQGLSIVGISVDEEGRQVVYEFIEEYGINYPIAHASIKNVMKQFGPIRGYPTTFIFNQKGELVNTHLGYRPAEVFETEIKGLLSTSS